MPINRIRLGKIHTIHKESGLNASDNFWYEPNFVKANLVKPENNKDLIKKFKLYKEKIWSLNYSSIIEEALMRYVRAFDERDQNLAFLKLWTAIETLTTPNQADYKKLAKRVAFIFPDPEYHKQVLMHLIEYRNDSVHAGEQSEKAKKHSYLLQYYFHKLILFHLINDYKFNDLNEANEFLDLPHNLADLNSKHQLLENAIRFKS